MGKKVCKQISGKVKEVIKPGQSVILSNDLFSSEKEPASGILGEVGIRISLLDSYEVWSSFFGSERVKRIIGNSNKNIIIPTQVVERVEDDLGALVSKSLIIKQIISDRGEHLSKEDRKNANRVNRIINRLGYVDRLISSVSRNTYSDINKDSLDLAKNLVGDFIELYNEKNPNDRIDLYDAPKEYIALSLLSFLFSRKSLIASRNKYLHSGFEVFYSVLSIYAKRNNSELSLRFDRKEILPYSLFFNVTQGDNVRSHFFPGGSYGRHPITGSLKLPGSTKKSLDYLTRKHWLK